MSDSIWQSSELKLRYKLLETIAESGYSHVYKVHDNYLDIDVAIKFLKPGLADKNFVQFQNEAKIAGSLAHKNIQNVLDFGLVEEIHPYLVFDFIDGESLSERLHRKGTVNPGECIEIFSQICEGMAFAHSKNVLHRDIKPGNIMLSMDEDGSTVVKIVDFGLAKFKPVDSSDTPTKGLIGTPLYMAPEQADGIRNDKRSDIYSMGCLMYECLTGKPPFVGDSPAETIMLHRTQKVEPMDEELAVPTSLEQVVQECLNKDPNERVDGFDLLKRRLFVDPNLENVRHTFDGEKSTVSTNKLVQLISLFVILMVVPVLAIYMNYSNPPPESKELPPTGIKPVMLHETNPFQKIDVAAGKIVYNSTLGFHDTNMIGQLKTEPKIDVLQIWDADTFTGVGLNQFDWLVVSELRIRNCPISKKGLSEIAKLKGLKSLYLEKIYSLNDEDLEELKGAEKLRWIVYSGTNFSEDSIGILARNTVAHGLLPANLTVTRKGIDYLSTSNATISGIELRDCNLDDEAIEAITNLKVPIGIALWSQISDLQLKILARAENPKWYWIKVMCDPKSKRAIEDLSKIKRLMQIKVPNVLSKSLKEELAAKLKNVTISYYSSEPKNKNLQTIFGIVDKEEVEDIAEFEMNRKEKH